MARDMETLERVSQMAESHRGFELLRQAALKKLERQEDSVSRLMLRTRTPVEPMELEYFRGFRQGVMYVVDGLPNEIAAQFKRELTKEMNN